MDIHRLCLLFSHFPFYFYLPFSLDDRWGTKDVRATTLLHTSLFSVVREVSLYFKPVHFVMLYFHLFFRLPFLLSPCLAPNMSTSTGGRDSKDSVFSERVTVFRECNNNKTAQVSFETVINEYSM